MVLPYFGRDVAPRDNCVDAENAQLRVENEALCWKVREMEVQNSDLRKRLGDGRRALVILAAIVLGGPTEEEEVLRWVVRTPPPPIDAVSFFSWWWWWWWWC